MIKVRKLDCVANQILKQAKKQVKPTRLLPGIALSSALTVDAFTNNKKTAKPDYEFCSVWECIC